ncbi:serine hydrolase [Streptomyces sp. CNQ085]|uniref:serine hydrolase n=1 Tax=Streptomyces sp. CNQ085 TaxID=2886944 RepID=UPI001F513B8A|nr:serine hydrolase [Streptomyces sp. CNQ085]MCI0383833.1 serine hydrolase [Streptomyces sp. CNQ085]
MALYGAPRDEAEDGGEEPSPDGDDPAGTAGEDDGSADDGAGAKAVLRVPEGRAEDGGAGEDDVTGTGDAEEADGGTGPAGEASAAGTPEPEDAGGPGAGAAGQATAVFPAPGDTAGSDEDREDAEGDKDHEDAEGDKDGADAETGRPVGQATAMLRVRPGGASGKPAPNDPEETDPEEAGAPGKPGADGRSETSGKPGTDGKPEETGPPATAGDPVESEAERTSRFVPLRSADAPRVPPAAVSPEQPPHTPGPELPEAERTKQQPLPPHKSLELLAELTNKPAPPETPVRVALRRVKIWSPLVLLLVIVLAVAQLMRPLPAPELVLTAPATHTFEGDEPTLNWPPEGQAVLEVEGLGSLGSYGEERPVPIASVAKVMTAYVILRDHPLKAGEEGPRIPVDAQAEKDAGLSAQGESTVEVTEGEEITLSEALHALMIASANNVARLLARWDSGGSEEAFVEKMNAAAEELGMENTTYTDASGLREDTVSTAADQVELGKKVMDYEAFREIVKKPSYEDRNGVSHRNWNGLVPYNRAVGIKTGTTTAAGGNLLFAGEKEVGGTTQLIVGAVMSQHKPSIIDTVVAESRELLISAQEVLRSERIVAKGDVVGYVDDGLGGRTQVVATEDVSAVGWSGLEVELALTDGGKGVPHTAAPGDTVGTLTVGSGPGQVKVPVAVRGELAEPDAGTRLTRIL